MYLHLFVFILSIIMSTSFSIAQNLAASAGQDGEVSAFWAPYFAKIEQAGKNGGASSTTRIHSQTLSLERRISSAFELGFDLTYEFQDQSSNRILPGFAESASLLQDSYEVNLFGRWTHGIFSIEPNFRFGLEDYKLTRPDPLTGLTARSKTNGYHLGAYIEASALIPLNDFLFLRPIADFDYEYLTADPFVETGNGLGNVSYGRVEDERAIGQIGAALGASAPLSDTSRLTAFINAKYRRNFITGPVQTDARLAANNASLGKQTLSEGQEKQGLILDAGTIINKDKRFELWTLYRGQYFPSSTRHGFAAQLKLTF